MSRFEHTPGLVSRCGLPVAVLLVMISLAASSGELRGQDADQMTDLLEIWMHHPLTGEALPTETPHPIRGVLGDGVPDKLPYYVLVHAGGPVPVDEGDHMSEVLELLRGEVSYHIEVGPAERAVALSNVPPGHADGEEGFRWLPTGDGYYSAMGEIDLPFDVRPETILHMRAILERNGTPIDTFTTEIRPGMPELSFRSTIISQNIGEMEGLRITGTVSGRTGLEFAESYLTLSGRGEIKYEDFQIEFLANNPMMACTIDTSTRDGYFQALEVVLFDDSLPPPAPDPEPGVDLAPNEVVFGIEPGIGESARISCPGSPVTFPLPEVLHFFAGFLSIHGGEVDGQPNEFDEGRGGLVMQGWEPGAGDLIATRTYNRQGSINPGTLIEKTTLELRWRE